jgi:hypothetical protein
MSSSSFENNQNQNITQKKKRGGSQRRSWVWDWFVSSDDDKFAICQVEVVTGEKCGKQY